MFERKNKKNLEDGITPEVRAGLREAANNIEEQIESVKQRIELNNQARKSDEINAITHSDRSDSLTMGLQELQEEHRALILRLDNINVRLAAIVLRET